MTLRIACSALGKRIFAGHLTKDGTRFREPRHDVTSDVLKAVIDKIEIGNEVEVSDGESIVARIAVLPPVTTPARAEAQDEGAALSDEDHEVIRRCVERQLKLYLRGQHKGYYIHSDIASLIYMIGRAHPSPTPAADADRVRTLETAMKTACNLLAERTHGNPARSPGHNARLELEAALKSTGAKEGGEA